MTAQIFWVPPIISGMDKATNFKFCMHILSINQNNSPLKISGAVAGCVVRTLKTFKCTHILGASCGLLCDSYAVLFENTFKETSLILTNTFSFHFFSDPQTLASPAMWHCVAHVILDFQEFHSLFQITVTVAPHEIFTADSYGLLWIILLQICS